jgi:hypothetical protein
MGWTIGVLGFDSQWGLGIFLFTTVSRMALGPTQTPIKWVPDAISLGVKRLGNEADHSPPSIAEVKECMELYLHSPIMPSWHGAQLKSTGTTLPFTFTCFYCTYLLTFHTLCYKRLVSCKPILMHYEVNNFKYGKSVCVCVCVCVYGPMWLRIVECSPDVKKKSGTLWKSFFFFFYY